tara:strand:+ start:142 stop:276 length:135 start_codon:yes stop_codon:yes gene_type:complete
LQVAEVEHLEMVVVVVEPEALVVADEAVNIVALQAIKPYLELTD